MGRVIQISSREFQANQKDYFDLADNGTQIILKRGRKPAYILTPVEDEDLFLSPELKERIDKGLQDIKEEKGREYSLDELKVKMGL
ncbi:MAG: hypothetical protein LBQ39_07230 [Tannerellaceae bacterium]|jgi:hypothetical protein|nr:hypothetical protein [Tannerellaceae bacterium]